MAEASDDQRKKAQVFFQRGKTVAATGQYEYAIDMFLEGLALDPEAVDAHADLRDISLRRKASGGKALGMMERMKLLRPSKDDKTNMLAAEKVLAYDPGNTDAMQGILTSGNRGGFWGTVMWVGPIFERANADSAKPDFKKFIVLKDVYKDLKQWSLAARACQYAVQLKPDDMDLTGEVKNLAALDTMRKGNYAGEGGFQDSVRDKDAQQKLMDGERDVRSLGFLEKLIREAEVEYKANPNEPMKMIKLVEAMVKTEQMEYENRAIELLQEWYDKTKQFRFRRNIGQINIKIWGRMDRGHRDELKAKPGDAKLAADYKHFLKDKIEFELSEYALWADNYPTEMLLRFEQAKRLYQLRRFDEAIPVFQTAASDPKLRIDAYTWLGKAFYEAGFADEAAQILDSAINEYPARNDDKAKDMFYWRGRSLEQMGDVDGALKFYSQLAQWQFNYLDVQQRIKKLREERAKK